MIRYERPDPPEDFQDKSAAVLDDLCKYIREWRGPLETATLPFDRKFWSTYTCAFEKAQHWKCGYCERHISRRTRDLEHYAPKAEVTVLSPASVRTEAPGGKPTGTPPALCRQPGYWWLAYCWENWLIACKDCNQYWKLNLFPVRDDNHPDCSLKPETSGFDLNGAEPLLLNPFFGPDPEDALEFERSGGVLPGGDSPHGPETIRTCGLNRTSLVRRRGRLADHIALLCHLAVRSRSRPAEFGAILSNLANWSRPGAEHAAVARGLLRARVYPITDPEITSATRALCQRVQAAKRKDDRAALFAGVQAVNHLGAEHLPFAPTVQKVAEAELRLSWQTLARKPAAAPTLRTSARERRRAASADTSSSVTP